MDRFECFVAGHKIGAGIVHRNNTATSFGIGTFPMTKMFQSFLDRVRPPDKHQLENVRIILHGVHNFTKKHSATT